MKMLKRKEVDEVSDDFSDFSLSAPARKIRRLVLVLTILAFCSENSRFFARIIMGFVLFLC
jgi:hypothetical protein